MTTEQSTSEFEKMIEDLTESSLIDTIAMSVRTINLAAAALAQKHRSRTQFDVESHQYVGTERTSRLSFNVWKRMK